MNSLTLSKTKVKTVWTEQLLKRDVIVDFISKKTTYARL